jgi:hypothetical protein
MHHIKKTTAQDGGRLQAAEGAGGKACARMKRRTKDVATARGWQSVEGLLAEAMKQPGVGTVIEVAEAAAKYNSAAAGYHQYMCWRRFASSSGSCNTGIQA